MLRLCACLGISADIIEPCGFPLNDREFKRAGMDYLGQATVTRHIDWNHFLAAIGHNQPKAPRIVLLTTKSSVPHTELIYRKDDILLVGQESKGAPEFVHAAAGARVRVPMAAGARSLNVAISAAIVLGEALRQTAGWPLDSQIKETPHVG